MNKVALGVIVALGLAGGLYLWTRYEAGPRVSVVSPAGGEAWVVGDTRTISWSTKNIPAEYNISVAIRRIPPPPLQTEGQEFDPLIFVGLPNTGSVEWTIADMYPEGTYVLEVTSYESVPVTDPVSGVSGEFRITKAPMTGGDRDSHGCIGSAGYLWCEARKECIRSWETYCTATVPKKVTFSCEDSSSITASFYIGDDAFVDLELSDGRKLSVPRAVSASGARYAKPDESFVFWNKGDTAFITEGPEGAETYTNCALTR